MVCVLVCVCVVYMCGVCVCELPIQIQANMPVIYSCGFSFAAINK